MTVVKEVNAEIHSGIALGVAADCSPPPQLMNDSSENLTNKRQTILGRGKMGAVPITS